MCLLLVFGKFQSLKKIFIGIKGTSIYCIISFPFSRPLGLQVFSANTSDARKYAKAPLDRIAP